MNRHLVTLAISLCFDSLLITSSADQENALRTRLLECDSHELVEQFTKNDLAGDGLRHFDHRPEIKVFDWCANRAAWTGRSLSLPEIGIPLVELQHLPIGSPGQVTVTGLPHVPMRNILQSAR